jgi:hydroxymethylpyrimidine pyrophosphatase-like HAD family hydrolase
VSHPSLPVDVAERIRAFHDASRFAERGGIVIDLDGTAVHEQEGQVFVAPPVVDALRAIAALGRPVVLNTLRFPLNVIRTFGRVWSDITHEPLPLVSLNGSVVGVLVPTEGDLPGFEELTAFPLSVAELEDAARGLETLIRDGLQDIVVFHYPRDWREGEHVWTPRADHVDALRERYRSATEVHTSSLAEFRDALLARGALMLSVLVDIPEDRRMAYQHVDPNRFVTTAGVDKLAGARAAAERLGFDLEHSVGAGDTPMDRFLAGVGLSLHVGPMRLEFLGRSDTVRLRDPFELGAALFELAELTAGRARGGGVTAV